MRFLLSTLAAAAAFLSSAQAQIIVTEPWVRATVPQQKVSGAYMQIKSATRARLVGVASPAAASVEIHAMAMDGNTMQMRDVDGIDLPAGKPVRLASGGYHLMLMGLKGRLKEGDTVPLTLIVETAAKRRETYPVKATVRALTYAPAPHH